MIAWLRRLSWWFRTSAPDPEAFLAEVRRAQGGRYSKMDRYRDFRAVFQSQSSPAQGRRVLQEIMTWSRMSAPVVVAGDPHMTYFREGERNIGLRIMQTMNAEPSDRSEQAKSHQPKE